MHDCNIIESLGQVSSVEAGTIFGNFVRGSVRQMICEVMAAEVTELCGPKLSGFEASGRLTANHKILPDLWCRLTMSAIEPLVFLKQLLTGAF